MRLSIAIMGVPARQNHIVQMIQRLELQMRAARGAGLRVEGLFVYSDTKREGPWAGWRGAWLTHTAAQSTHHVVLQDDLDFCADLPATLWALATARPEVPISGFLPRKAVSTAAAAGISWVETKRFLWAQCLLLPVALGDRALTWIAAQEAANPSWGPHDDTRLAAFFAAEKIRVYVPVPHPVEHIGDALGGSTMGHNFDPAKRRARAWIGPYGSGGALPWNDLRTVKDR